MWRTAARARPSSPRCGRPAGRRHLGLAPGQDRPHSGEVAHQLGAEPGVTSVCRAGAVGDRVAVRAPLGRRRPAPHGRSPWSWASTTRGAERGRGRLDHHRLVGSRADRLPRRPLGRGQHVRQVGVRIGDLVDVEEDRTRDVGGLEVVAALLALRGHVPGGVHHLRVGIGQMAREPLRGDEGIAHSIQAGVGRPRSLKNAGLNSFDW